MTSSIDLHSDVTAEDIADLQDEIRTLARKRNAVILAHNYQRPEVQDVADVVGDSLGLSREAASTEADVIVFCGVHFMAETAAILSPDKTILLPDLAAGCSLAATIDGAQLRQWKSEHPGAVVVSYVNTSAEVKAESDYCCTSGNAVDIVNRSEYGLSLAILSKDALGALALADRMHSGIVHINDQTVDDEPIVPFGGVGDSGTGSRFGGADANIEAFTETQWVTMQSEIERYPF